ncbi:nucleoside/nucleotide kinase family protein [Streptacidiphilus fuscans]|uniref:Uridine kinase n=1 Tax=Streptacidiphilus fuscans TaxID=2789292 RepID=A0A931B462_9ACTN|nr:uridine kinase [Streptacidiphilus fuscans]MBF9070799.1 uridine kinase [Streptacidiphilus fuscans]
MQVRPLTPELLAEELAERIDTLGAASEGNHGEPSWLRVAVDGADAARPGELADALVEPLRLRGRPVQRIRARDFLRPASLRFEFGHRDPDAYLDRWLDAGALFREVFDPTEPGGSGEVLPSLWDPVADRATRAARLALPPGGVVLLDGPMLLGRWFPLDLTVHLRLSAAALERRTAADEHWTLPALARYDAEVQPEQAADMTVRADDPRRPALVVRA